MQAVINNIIVVITSLILLAFFFHKKIRTSQQWRATATPLASIIGSGFLVSAPLLMTTSGPYAAYIMIAITIIGYGLGYGIRFNIQYAEPLQNKAADHKIVHYLEIASSFTLGSAYLISVTFYLKLLSAFAMHGIGLQNTFFENILTTLLLITIAVTGKLRGLHLLESYETYAVNIKLSIIIAFLVGLVAFNIEAFVYSSWAINIHSQGPFTKNLREILGIIIIIQGFETSRYLGSEYPAKFRVKTMRAAQLYSATIYIIFISLILIVPTTITAIHDTTIIDISYKVAPVLFPLLIMAAIFSQYSAAISDTIGCSGLIHEFTRSVISIKTGYLIIGSCAIFLT